MSKFARLALSLCLLCALGLGVLHVAPAAKTAQFDVAVIGGTPAGIMAAVAAARLGEKVLLVEPSRHLGGGVSGGLTASDVGRDSTSAGCRASSLISS